MKRDAVRRALVSEPRLLLTAACRTCAQHALIHVGSFLIMSTHSCWVKILRGLHVSCIFGHSLLQAVASDSLQQQLDAKVAGGARSEPCSRLCLGSCTAPTAWLQASPSGVRLNQHQ